MLDESAHVNDERRPLRRHGAFRGAQEAVGGYASRRAGDQRRALHPQRAPLAARRRDHRADDLHPMVRAHPAPGRSRRCKPCATGASASCRNASPRSITTGWKTSRIGASAANCGGGTASRCGTARTCGKMIASREDPTTCPKCGSSQIWNRTRTCWIPGSPPGCGPFPRWAGRKRRRITSISTPPPCWRRATTSSSSGWRA